MNSNLDNTIKKLISLLGITVMFVIITNSLFYPTLSYIASSWRGVSQFRDVVQQNIFSFFLSVIVLGGLILLSKKLKLSSRTSTITVTIFSFLFFAYLMSQFYFLGIDKLIDDSNIVFVAAQEYLNTGKISTWYMASNPQNLFIMFFYILSIKLTGSLQILPLYIIFSLMHVATAILIYLSTKKLFSNPNHGLVAFLIFAFTLQINFHVIVMYTDVYSMFFLLLGIYLFISFTKASNIKQRIMFLVLSSIIFSFAFLAKGFYLILFIALPLGMLISLKGKDRLLLFIPIIIFIMVNSTWEGFISDKQIFSKEEIGMPNTHYIFMGMNTKDYFQPEGDKRYRLAGAYDNDDLGFSKGLFWVQNLPSEEIESIHLKEIAKRIQSISLPQFLEFLYAKVSSTWSSGDLKSTFSVGLASRSENRLQELKESIGVYTYFQTFQYIYYLLFLLLFIKMFLYPSVNPLFNVSVFFVVGIFFFTLMWESSPRYAMTIMPFAPVIFPYFLQSHKNS